MKIWVKTKDYSEGKYLVVRRDGTIPQWPHFVLGGDDPSSPAALRAYADDAEQRGLDGEYVGSIRELASEFEHRSRLAEQVRRSERGEKLADPDAPPHRKDNPAIIRLMRGEADLSTFSNATPAPDVTEERASDDILGGHIRGVGMVAGESVGGIDEPSAASDTDPVTSGPTISTSLSASGTSPGLPPVAGMETTTISPSDPHLTIAAIRQLGLAADGSDLRDLATAFDRLIAALAEAHEDTDAFERALEQHRISLFKARADAKKAREDEREACAKLVENLGCQIIPDQIEYTVFQLSAAIRARTDGDKA